MNHELQAKILLQEAFRANHDARGLMLTNEITHSTAKKIVAKCNLAASKANALEQLLAGNEPPRKGE